MRETERDRERRKREVQRNASLEKMSFTVYKEMSKPTAVKACVSGCFTQSRTAFGQGGDREMQPELFVLKGSNVLSLYQVISVSQAKGSRYRFNLLTNIELGGEIQETSKKNVLKAIAAQDLLQEEDNPQGLFEDTGLG